MTFGIDVVPSERHAGHAASVIAETIPQHGSLVLTGGTTAQRIYPRLAEKKVAWDSLTVLFSDERCVPPDHEASNFRMARTLLLDMVGAPAVRRMLGEDDPDTAAAGYHADIGPDVDQGLDLLLVGMGEDCHIGAMFPGSPALDEWHELCRAVDRPDGMKGLTLTPPAMLSAKKVLLLVTGAEKSDAVRRVIQSDEPVADCPARLLAGHADATFLLDEQAASRLT
ncbi:MAG: 6-phosphogluconolactonase [Actinomycetota bacterium]|nr:6-phosphogluconolactonase [Actinomycetota bacterium]